MYFDPSIRETNVKEFSLDMIESHFVREGRENR